MNQENVIREIRELPKLVADKIAAGEVVDRPLSIVKELLENAIDAGANSIIVDIKNGGKSYIRVTDDGCGIPKEQTELAFKRHATSKIRESEDLEKILTLGFRGEALSSIAAVSRTELITKTKDEKTGISIKIEGGILSDKSEIGCPEGTTIIVSDLFFNTPAREKFLKADHTESTLIIDFVSKMALAYPEKRIRLINNSSILFSTNGKNDKYSNILTVFSKEIGESLIYFEEEDSQTNFKIEGFISRPQFTKTNRKSQIFFVNGRYIQSKIIESAITSAYADKIFDGRYPSAYLFLKIPPEKLDVNIHPNKKEVRFESGKNIMNFLISVISKNLNQKEAIPELKNENIFKLNLSEYEHNPKQENLIKDSQVDIITFQSTRRDEPDSTSVFSEILKVKEEPHSANQVYNVNKIEEKTTPPKPPKPFEILSINLIGSIFNTYLLGADENSFYLIDQHAAHERVFYEEFLAQLNEPEKNQQIILAPIVKEVSYAVKHNIENWLYFLKNIGFDIEEFGVKSYIIKSIPLFMELTEAENFLTDFLETVDEDTDFNDKQKVDKIIMKSCKNAVKAHDHLDMKEMEALLTQLSRCSNPFSCPHGRPVFIRMTQYEIEKMFKRV